MRNIQFGSVGPQSSPGNEFVNNWFASNQFTANASAHLHRITRSEAVFSINMNENSHKEAWCSQKLCGGASSPKMPISYRIPSWWITIRGTHECAHSMNSAFAPQVINLFHCLESLQCTHSALAAFFLAECIARCRGGVSRTICSIFRSRLDHFAPYFAIWFAPHRGEHNSCLPLRLPTKREGKVPRNNRAGKIAFQKTEKMERKCTRKVREKRGPRAARWAKRAARIRAFVATLCQRFTSSWEWIQQQDLHGK